MAKRLWSVFTEDMDHCMYTGSSQVERHHVFGGAYRKKSEKYGFIAPLRPDLHPNGVFAVRDAKSVDLKLKRASQAYFEKHYGTREQFIQEFGRNYLGKL